MGWSEVLLKPTKRPQVNPILQTNTDNRERVKDFFSDAFIADAFYTCVVPNKEVRKEKTKSIFHLAFTAGLSYGQVFMNPEKTVASLWLPPGESISLFRALRNGVVPLAFNMGVSSSLRFKSLNEQIEHAREELASKRHWYLLLFGVDPKVQRSGLGKAMLQANMQRFADSKVPFYLETFNPNNVAFYNKLGFELLEERKTKEGPVFWCMETK